MSDVIEEGVPEINWESLPKEDYDIRIEGEDPPLGLGLGVVDEEVPEGYKGKSPKELIAELEALKLKQGAPDAVQALRDAVTDLGGVLRQPPSVQVPQLPGETEAQYKERFEKEFYDKPYEMLMEFQQKKITPAVQQLMQNNLYHSKKYVELDPKRSALYSKYTKDVEELVSRASPEAKLRDPEIYQNAVDQVASRHFDDILSDRLKIEVEKQVAEALKVKPSGSGSGASRPNWSEGQPIPRVKPQPTHVGSLTALEASWARNKGIPIEMAWEVLQKNPLLKKGISDGRA